MSKAILGKKIGMTRLFTAQGASVPVTVVQAGPCFVSQVKTPATDGYSAIQLGFDEVKPRNSTIPMIGHDAKAGIAPQRFHREVRVADAAAYQAGQVVDTAVLEGVMFVDVTGTSKGKGFAGAMKRHGFKGMCASHGTERKHRSPGSIAGRGSNRGWGPPKKGIRMPGRMGGDQVTTRNIKLFGIDKEKGLLLLQGAVPGGKNGLLFIKEAKRLWKPKAKLVAAAAK
jgi:large subunit ribosomal protein L3